MVHHRMLTRLRQHLYNTECCRSSQGASPGIGAAGGGGNKRHPGWYRGIPEGGVDHGGTDGGGVRRHVGPLPLAMAPMVPGREDVEHVPVGEGFAVLDTLHPGDILLSLHKEERHGMQ